MEIMPSEYNQIDLSRNEKIFVRNIMSNDLNGYLLLDTNPAMLPNEKMHILVCSDGILVLKFFDGLNDVSQYASIMPMLIDGIYRNTAKIILSKILSNKALIDEEGKLRFAVNLIYVFPLLQRGDINNEIIINLNGFPNRHCFFKEDLQRIRTDLQMLLISFLDYSLVEISRDKLVIDNDSINSILQRIAPEYVTIRVSAKSDNDSKPGVANELLVINENDTVVKAYRLDAEQINIVNKIRKGDQLILACAGSGKSVLLISKCFKAAAMNPDKKFLITCYNKNLHSLYTWFIDQAGLRAKNVICLTFHALCRKLLIENHISVSGLDVDGYVDRAIINLNKGSISNRFYGIFIDEVQQFDSEWYKFCFNLLENKSSDDHLFVICGDKTQKLANLQKHGRAPWNVGEGYPNYRGGNKSIRIERNYRNCIEINEFINRYVANAKQYLYSIDQNIQIDPDEFLRGKSVFHGKGVNIKYLTDRSNLGEANVVYDSIKAIHDSGIPYDEIAVIVFNKKYSKRFSGWKNKKYNLNYSLLSILEQEDIPCCKMFNDEENWGARYGDDGGVRFITFQSALGLDFRAAIVCGLLPLGEYDGTKKPDWSSIKNNEDELQEMIKHTEDNIRFLYVACTRAKEILHIVLPETSESSNYIKMLEDAK